MAVGLFTTQGNPGCEPYLKVVGPAPLRFEVIAPNNPVFMAELALPKPGNPGAPVEVSPARPTAGGNGSGQEMSSADGNPAQNPFGIFGGQAKNAANPANAASDMLNITPQMIGNYLKPYPSVPLAGPSPFQPGQSILVPAELGFVPPMPGGSRAIYMSK